MLLAPLQTSSDTKASTTSNFTALFSVVLQTSDLGVVAFAGAAAHWLRFGRSLGLEDVRNIAIGVVFAALVFGSSQLYRNWRSLGLASEAFQVLRMWSVAFAATVVFAVALKFANEVSRIWWTLWYAGGLCGLLATRILCRHLAAAIRRAGLDVRSAVVIGGTPLAGRVIETLIKEQWAGIQIRGWFNTLDIDGPTGVFPHESIPHLGDLNDLPSYVEAHNIQEVWLALPLGAQDQIDGIIASLRHSTADIKLVPDLFGIRLLNQSIGQVAGLPVISLQQSPLQGMDRLVKALEDRVLAALILILISPVMAVLAIAVKVSSPGPVFYRQERLSWNNRRFNMLKFRSMPVDAELKTGAVWARGGESRATPVGAFLRKTSLDELPQFINVLRGEMSIVGPRPERPVFVEKFKHEIPAYMKKHMVKAGITGWAQVNGWRGSTDLSRRVECDLFYIQNWSLAFDAKIIFLTIFKGFINKNAY